MTSEWREARLSQLCSVITDGAHKSPPTVTTGMPMASVKDLTRHGIQYQTARHISFSDYEELERSGCCPKIGDVLIAKDGNSALETVCVHADERDICLLSSVAIFRPGQDLDSGFLRYFLESPRTKYILKGGYVSGSAIPRVVLRDFKMLPVHVPSKEEQIRISSILASLDDKIELNRKTNETLEGIAKALFKAWFVDFDPARAKAEGRPTGLPDEISELFPDSFDESELGEIPSGWKFVPLTQILQVDPKRSLPRGSVSPYLEMKAVPTSGHSADGVYFREFTSGTKFKNGDTLLARITPCLENGKTAMVDFLEGGQIGWGSTEFIVLCGIRPEHNSFAYYLARSSEFREHAIRNMVGSSGRQRVPSDALADFYLPQAPLSILNAFSSLADSLLGRISHASQENSTLSELRDALLPRLISGELRVPDAEKMLEEVGI